MELKGSLKKFSLPDIVQLIGSTRRSGVLVIVVGPDKASLYFEEGRVVHANYRERTGQEAINRMFLEQEGSFQFLSGVEAPEKSLSMDHMGILMEAARLQDEDSRDLDLNDLDLEGAAAGGGAAQRQLEAEAKEEPWDPAPIKEKMKAVLEEAFGKKARKITKELAGSPGDKLSLLEFCDKAEKYITVFIDNRRAEEIANRLRSVIEEHLL